VDEGGNGLFDLGRLYPGELVKGHPDRTDKRRDTENCPRDMQGCFGLGDFLDQIHVVEDGRKPSAVEGGIIGILEPVTRGPWNPGEDIRGDAFELDGELEIRVV